MNLSKSHNKKLQYVEILDDNELSLGFRYDKQKLGLSIKAKKKALKSNKIVRK